MLRRPFWAKHHVQVANIFVLATFWWFRRDLVFLVCGTMFVQHGVAMEGCVVQVLSQWLAEDGLRNGCPFFFSLRSRISLLSGKREGLSRSPRWFFEDGLRNGFLGRSLLKGGVRRVLREIVFHRLCPCSLDRGCFGLEFAQSHYPNTSSNVPPIIPSDGQQEFP